MLWPIAMLSRILVLAIVAAGCWSIATTGRARLLSAAATGLLVSGAIAPVGYWLLIPREARFPASGSTLPPAPFGIIALGGDSGHRLNALAQLSRLFPHARLVYSRRGDRRAAAYEIAEERIDP